MAVTQADLDALDAAIASGETRVEIDGRTVEFGNARDMLRRRTFIARQLQAQQDGFTRARPRYQVATFDD